MPPVLTVDSHPVDAVATHVTKPSTIDLSGDSTNVVESLRWAGWDEHGATGYGVVDILGCVPNCAQGSSVPTPVTIYLNDPVDGGFTLLTEDIRGQPSRNFTLPPG